MREIIMDVDTGVDDSIAILLAIKSGVFKIKGITTVVGNTSLENATKNTLKVLNLAKNLDIPVYKGASRPLGGKAKQAPAHGNDGLCGVYLPPPIKKPNKLSANKFLLNTLLKNPGKIEIVATTPLTNIAYLFKKYPKSKKKIKKLYIMGGAFERSGNITPFAEFNFYHDAKAAKIVLKSGVPMIIIPLDVTCQLPLTTSWMERNYGKSKDPITKFILKIVKKQREIMGGEMFYLHDPLALGVAIDKSFVKTKKTKVDIITYGKRRGMIVNSSKGAEVEWAFKLNKNKFFVYFKKMLLKK
jgi:purine nucleosidase